MMLHRAALLSQGYNPTESQPSTSTARPFLIFILDDISLKLSDHCGNFPAFRWRRLVTSPSFKVITLNVNHDCTIQQPSPLLSIDHFRLSFRSFYELFHLVPLMTVTFVSRSSVIPRSIRMVPFSSPDPVF